MFFSDFNSVHLAEQLTGSRFTATYRLFGSETEARNRADDICTEQTVEFPRKLLPHGTIPEHILGRIESFTQEDSDTSSYLATISFPAEVAAAEPPQFLNVLFGNFSMKPGVQLVSFEPSSDILSLLPGPQFGIAGIRKIIGVEKRPPLFTALKPMGLSPANLATLAKQFALGGIDVIKDDHGLSNQRFCPFQERVDLCCAAVAEANAETGGNSIYVPNITAPVEIIKERVEYAVKHGAGAVMLSSGLVGIDILRSIAAQHYGVPIIVHPALQGGLGACGTSTGICCGVLYGLLMRLFGADATIFPNFGGRFPLTLDDCRGIVSECRRTLPADAEGRFCPIFPSPAGGMELKNIPKMLEEYGSDILVLVGSGLFAEGSDLRENCRKFVEAALSA